MSQEIVEVRKLMEALKFSIAEFGKKIIFYFSSGYAAVAVVPAIYIKIRD